MRRLALSFLAASLVAAPSRPIPQARLHPDHHEFEAVIDAPFQGLRGEARPVRMAFQFPDAEELSLAAWRVELVGPAGSVLRAWHGETPMNAGQGAAALAWDGADAQGRALAPGFYTLRLSARSLGAAEFRTAAGATARERVELLLGTAGAEELQELTVQVGRPAAPRLRSVQPLARAAAPRGARALAAAAPAPGGLPYTVVYGNMHSQTNHSDGGSVVSACSGSEVPQAGTQGPADAFEMMRVQAGGDFLLASEHNHMFDGSTATNAAADPAASKALFASGLSIAAGYRNDHPGFLALYGMEWGVISGGGHLNILNPDGLATWESNGSGQLLGDYFTPKSDYPTLYSFMKSKGWIGQFNHPKSDQFGGLIYTPDGDEAMALCEVMNTSAFSKNLTQTETSRSFYDGVWNRLLEAGYHLAPSTDQDNHCANWGLSYTNRTGVLLPSGAPATFDAFMAAVKARRVFATMDKGAQLVLTTGDGGLMGDRLTHGGPLTLNVAFSTATAGRSAARVQIMEGVPGRNGTVTQLEEGAGTWTFTPEPGAHFYYAVVTEDNGDKLWSAPIWVQQQAGPVTAAITQPTGSVTVASGTTVSFAATAATSNAAIASTTWSFGDGGSAAGLAADHTFDNAGAAPLTYTVSFTATDDTGATGLATRSVTVLPVGGINTAPTVSAIPSQSGPKDAPFAPIAFTVGDAETPAAQLQVSVAGSNPTLFPDANVVLESDGASQTLSLTPAPDQTGTATFTVTVTDPQGLSTVRSFQATVYAQGAGQARLIISQYYEGLSFDKWVEVTNVGTAPYDAAAAPLYLGLWANPFTNGTTYAATPIAGTLGVGESRLYKNGQATKPTVVTGTPVVNNAVINFNGDDITYITPVATAGKAGYDARVDAIGENSAFWATSVSGGYGKDRSFVRNFNVVQPNATFTIGEWTLKTLAEVDGAADGTVERLGVHRFNTAPTISDLPAQTLEANTVLGPLAVTLGDADTAADALTLTVSSSDPSLVPAENLVLGGSGADRTLTLTPAVDQSGTAVITLTVTDAQGLTATDTFVLTVKAPVSRITGVSVTPAAAFVDPGQTVALQSQVTGTYAFSRAVTWETTGGTVLGAADGSAVFTAPAAGGTYTVTARSVQDPSVTGSATVQVNHAPVAQDQSLLTNQDTALPIVLGATDAEGTALTWSLLSQPAHGTLAGTAPNLTYTPARHFHGTDSFTFSAKDGSLSSGTATVMILVDGRPHAEALVVETSKERPVAVTLVGRDPENEPLTYTVQEGPANGALTGSGANLTYTPKRHFFGLDWFTYTVQDGHQSSRPETVFIIVLPGRRTGWWY